MEDDRKAKHCPNLSVLRLHQSQSIHFATRSFFAKQIQKLIICIHSNFKSYTQASCSSLMFATVRCNAELATAGRIHSPLMLPDRTLELPRLQLNAGKRVCSSRSSPSHRRRPKRLRDGESITSDAPRTAFASTTLAYASPIAICIQSRKTSH
jgi:hypothetical protein